MRKFVFAGVAVVLLVGMTAMAQSVSIQFDGANFRVTPWKGSALPPAGGWPSVFAVYTAAGEVPALLGSYAVEDGALVFRPTYPIAAGVHYRAVFRAPGGGTRVEKDFDGPHLDRTPSTRVLHVYPSTDVLPSNDLRLYIYFSAPMSRGETAQHIHMLDENGKVLEGTQGVFLPGEELWDPDFERLTMTFDPGRIKRGLTSNEKIGPPIAEGKRYTLVIDREWPDARGVPMVEGFRKSFRGGPAVRNPPDPQQWHVSTPKAGTSEALVVEFPEPMNYPLLERMLQVTTSAKAAVSGKVSIAREETEWRFTPQAPWAAGAYEIVVDTGLEDLAGNHIGQPFDIDTFKTVTEHITTKTISLPFHISR